MLVTDHYEFSGLFLSGNHVFDRLNRTGDGFFAENIYSALESIAGEGLMGAYSGREADQIEFILPVGIERISAGINFDSGSFESGDVVGDFRGSTHDTGDKINCIFFDEFEQSVDVRICITACTEKSNFDTHFIFSYVNGNYFNCFKYNIEPLRDNVKFYLRKIR